MPCWERYDRSFSRRDFATFFAVLAVFGSACESRTPSLTLFNAATLGPPFRAIADELRRAHPRIDVAQENSPSLEAVRKLTTSARSRTCSHSRRT